METIVPLRTGWRNNVAKRAYVQTPLFHECRRMGNRRIIAVPKSSTNMCSQKFRARLINGKYVTWKRVVIAFIFFLGRNTFETDEKKSCADGLTVRRFCRLSQKENTAERLPKDLADNVNSWCFQLQYLTYSLQSAIIPFYHFFLLMNLKRFCHGKNCSGENFIYRGIHPRV